jgi:hypothetical protein
VTLLQVLYARTLSLASHKSITLKPDRWHPPTTRITVPSKPARHVRVTTTRQESLKLRPRQWPEVIKDHLGALRQNRLHAATRELNKCPACMALLSEQRNKPTDILVHANTTAFPHTYAITIVQAPMLRANLTVCVVLETPYVSYWGAHSILPPMMQQNSMTTNPDPIPRSLTTKPFLCSRVLGHTPPGCSSV